MKFAFRGLLCLIALAAACAHAQTIQQGTFKHIIFVIQENRTPDNLFGSGPSSNQCGTEDPFEPGVDIENGGYGYVPQPSGPPQLQLICNTSLPLSAWDGNLQTPKVIDPDHGYIGWGLDFGGGNQNGFCHEYSSYSIYGSTCPSYSYVQRSDMRPYFDVATNYSFANYMFQTNEGPSFPAHQFLFTGTSAPVAPKDSNNYYLNFIAGNPQKPGGFGDSGCAYTDGTYGWPTWVKPDGTTIYPPPLLNECYTHDSLVTAAADCGTGNYCDRGLVSWAYYTPTRGIIWDAPEGIPEVCYQENNLNDIGKACGTVNGGQEWSSHVYLPDVNGYSDAPIFDDLYKCKLKQISWVVPDVAWSDHPQDKWKTNLGNVYGASYVGDIIDAVGGGMANSTCNGLGSGKYWTTEPTLVIVVWDDWGGWFDHVAPYIARQENPNQGYTQCDPSSQWGCGYTSGFRVPLMVVSPYTGTKNADGSYSGYVSGACGASPLPPCPNKTFPYVHDFGSILAFTEYNFNLSQIYPDTNYYADYNAPDWGTERGNIPLSDFFPLSTAQPRPFVSISTSKPFTYFQTYYQTTGASPTGPDDDDEADQ